MYIDVNWSCIILKVIYKYNAQTFMMMSKHKHIYLVNFDIKIQRRRMKQGQIPNLKFCKTYVCQETCLL